MRGQNAPHWAISSERGEFCTGDTADGGVPGEFSTGCGGGGGVPGEFFAELLRDGPQWANFFAEESLKALMVNVCMCARSPCGRLSSAGANFACNSPQGISSYEIESLKFCRFAPSVYVGSAGIACDFCGGVSCALNTGLVTAFGREGRR